MEGNCIFCKIVSGEASSDKVGENDGAFAFASIAPVAEHHYLIVPKKHVETFMDLEGNNTLAEMAKLAQSAIKEKNIAEGYKLVFNGGKYQSVAHLHWHLLGGKLEDERDVLNKI